MKRQSFITYSTKGSKCESIYCIITDNKETSFLVADTKKEANEKVIESV